MLIKRWPTNNGLRELGGTITLDSNNTSITVSNPDEIDYTRQPISVGMAEYTDTPYPLHIPESDETLAKMIYDDLIRAIFDTIGSELWATATFNTYRDLVLAQRYLLNYFWRYCGRHVITRTNHKDKRLYVRIAQ